MVIILTIFILQEGLFDFRTTDDGVKECASWYPVVNYMTIGYQNSNCTGDIHNGTRFLNVPIPNAADILTATYYLWDSDGCPSYDAATVDVDVTAYDIDNAPALSGSLDTYPKTTGSVDWSMIFTYGNDGIHSVSGVDNIVEEVISRVGWSENNALTILVDDNPGENDNGCVLQEESGAGTAARLQGTFTDFENTILSPIIEFSNFQCASNYDELRWDDDETYGDIKIHLYYDNSGTPAIIPDGDLAGNSTGFDVSPIDISALNAVTYYTLYIMATLRYTSINTNESPKLNSWSITANPVASVTASADQGICPGGSANLSVVSGCGAYTWSTGENGSDITVSPGTTTTYYVTATVGNGDTAIDSVVVTIAPLIPGAIGSDQNVCDGDTPADLTNSASASGGIGAVTYQWQEDPNCTGTWSDIAGETSVTLSFSSSLAQTTCYRRVATDDCGDKYSDTVTVTVNALSTANITPLGATTFCSGDSVGLQSGTATTYLWLFNGASTGQTTQSIFVSAAGDYQVVVTDTSGCTDTSATETITVDPLPTIDSGSMTIGSSNCGNSDGSITGITISGGTPAYTYEWVNSSLTVVGGDSADLVNVPSDSYTLTLTDVNGCSVTSGPHIIGDVGAPPAPTPSSPSPYCSGDSIADLTATGTGGTLYWFSDAALTDTLGSGSPFTTGATVTDTFYVAEMGACLGLATQVIITIDPSPAANITPLGSTTFCSGDSAELQSDAATTYLWIFNGSSTGQTTQNIYVSAAGDYQVVVTNSSGCTDTSAIETITVNSPPTANITPQGPTTFCSGDSVELQSDAATTYLWLFNGASTGQTTQSIFVSTAGDYQVVVTNGSGCTDTSAIEIVTINSPLTANITPQGPITFCNVGSVELQSDTANTYLWLLNGISTGQTTQSIFASAAGDYQVIVTDTSGCTDTSAIETVVVNPLPVIDISLMTIDSSNCGNSDGSITGITVSGGTPAYTFEWVNSTLTIVGGDSANLVNVPSDLYTLTVTDFNGCSASSGPFMISDAGAPPAPAASSPSPYCSGDLVDDLTATGIGGTLYWFSDVGLTDTLGSGSPFTSGATATDTFYVAEMGICISPATQVIITISPSPTANITALDTTTFCFGDNVELQSDVATTYEWLFNGISTGEFTQSIFASTTGGYQVVVTNADSCYDTSAVVIVTVNSLPTVLVTPDNTTICEGENVTLIASGSGITYTWSTGDNTASITVNPTADTTYSVTTTDANGCTDTALAVVTVASAPAASISGTTHICIGQSTVLTASGGASYVWNTGETTVSITITPTGTDTFYVVVSDTVCALPDTGFVTVIVYALPVIDASPDTSAISLGESADLSVSGGVLYTWTPAEGLDDPNSSTPVASPTVTTVYYVTGVDDPSVPPECVNTDSVLIIVSEDTIVFIPTLFSPNGDGINDILYVRGRGIDWLEFIIYNRWGEKVFEGSKNEAWAEENSYPPNVGWDGTYRGNEMNPAVFVYILKGAYTNGKEIDLKGNITMVR
ncbi:MAG: gliding motility-associated C-terminal domain-containing protein [Bacteroidota bacterium]